MTHSDQTTQEIVDLEAFAHDQKTPPSCGRYRIRIDRQHHIVQVPCLTGRELLELAGKCPRERYQVFQKLRGGYLEQIELDEKADLTKPGVERFVTLPLDQTEG